VVEKVLPLRKFSSAAQAFPRQSVWAAPLQATLQVALLCEWAWLPHPKPINTTNASIQRFKKNWMPEFFSWFCDINCMAVEYFVERQRLNIPTLNESGRFRLC